MDISNTNRHTVDYTTVYYVLPSRRTKKSNCFATILYNILKANQLTHLLEFFQLKLLLKLTFGFTHLPDHLVSVAQCGRGLEMERQESFPKVKPEYLKHLLVVACSVGHKLFGSSCYTERSTGNSLGLVSYLML